MVSVLLAFTALPFTFPSTPPAHGVLAPSPSPMLSGISKFIAFAPSAKPGCFRRRASIKNWMKAASNFPFPKTACHDVAAAGHQGDCGDLDQRAGASTN